MTFLPILFFLLTLLVLVSAEHELIAGMARLGKSFLTLYQITQSFRLLYFVPFVLVVLSSGHELIVGMTRMGKSFLTLYRIIQSFLHNRPTCFIDPRGDGYWHLLSYLAFHPQGQEIYQRYRDRIVFLNPVSNSSYRVAFNAIGPFGSFPDACPDPVALVSGTLISHLRRQFNSDWGATNRFEGIMAAAVGALLESGNGWYTLAELPKLFVPAFRRDGNKVVTYYPFLEFCLQRVSHPGTRIFFEDEWQTMDGHARREWVEPVNNRTLKYLFNRRILTTTCFANPQYGLDFRAIVREGKWLFVNLPYQYLSELGTTLLGNLIIDRLFYAGLQEWYRLYPYRLILDEARFFTTGPLDAIVERTGVARFFLTLLVQDVGQLARPGDDGALLRTVLNNTRYLYLFHTEAESEQLSKLLFPVTGTQEIGKRQPPNPVWRIFRQDSIPRPVEAEKDMRERRLTSLPARSLYFYDKVGQQEPQLLRSPEFSLPLVPSRKSLEAFEDQHLKRTGVPLSEIEEEIEARRNLVERIARGEFRKEYSQPSRSQPKPPGRRQPAPDFGEERPK